VIAGTGSNSTSHAVELQKRAASLGAHVGLSVNPYYNKPTPEGLYRHFSAVADATDMPVLLYNIPGRTGVTLQPDTIARLANHPNIIGVKEATGSLDSASEIARSCDVTILSGDDSLTLPFASVGGRGVVSVISNLIPSRVQAMCEAFNADHWADARAIHFELLPIARGLLSLATNPIPVKTAMRILGRDTGSLRLPLCEPDDTITRTIENLVRASGLR
jgi:4-hydroxy-tetrahydrodipicolinate synthase